MVSLSNHKPQMSSNQEISSLKRYIEALGGKLSLDVELSDGRHIGINV